MSFELNPGQVRANRLLTGGQRHSLLVGGARSGKTFLFVRAMAIRAMREKSRHAIVRLHYNSVRTSVWLDTFPSVMSRCFPNVPVTESRQDGFVSFPNGSEVWFLGLDDKDRVDKVLGKEFATLFFNECSQIARSSVDVALTRLAQKTPLKNRAYYDLNPTGTGHWTYRMFVEHKSADGRGMLPNPDDYAMLYVNPKDNEKNLDPEYVAFLEGLPAKQRARFFEGRYVAEIDGALWTIDMIERGRVDAAPADLKRVIVAVDPSGCSGPEDKRSDEIGITVTGLDAKGNGYLLADRSGRFSPEAWGRVAVNAWREFGADCIIGEKNFGGDMVRAVIQNVDRNAPYREVTASRGKAVRAEPIAAMYERGCVFHVGRFDRLEDQLVNFSTAGFLGDRSPDRADALVWGFTELFQLQSGIFTYYQNLAAKKASEAAAA